MLPVALLALVGLASTARATPIANTGQPTSLPAFQGAPAEPHPIRAARVPQNPFMAQNGASNVHGDSWMSDTYRIGGPLGHSPETLSTEINRVCITVTFDRKGRLVATCSYADGPHLFLFDPVTLATLAEMPLPKVVLQPGQDPLTNTTGGAYFYLDNRDRAVVATGDQQIWIVAESEGANGASFQVESRFDLLGVLGDDRVTSVLPDWSGKLWFVGRQHGTIGVLDPKSGAIRSIQLGEEVENSFAVDRDGVYIVSDRRMYRFGLDAGGTPQAVWSESYKNSGIYKPGQFNAGSGTTPTILAGGYVAITDNADPMNVVVYRTATSLPAGKSRLVCEVPVFSPGAGSDENSLIGIGSSLIAENNYGYSLAATVGGALTEPGVTRIDIDADGNGCHVVWSNTSERIPSVVSKLSLENGLIYTFTKDHDPENPTSDAWFWAALRFDTGELQWKQLAGTGTYYNNHYAGIVLGRDGTAYLGAVGGLLAIRDRDGASTHGNRSQLLPSLRSAR